MKKIILTSIVIGFGLVLAACTTSTIPSETKPESNLPSPTITISPSESLSPSPTLSQDTSLNSIETDLKATNIVEEDFSDIK